MAFKILVSLFAGAVALAAANASFAQEPPSETTAPEATGRVQSNEPRRRAPPPPPPTPAQILATAQGLLTSAGSTCQGVEATNIGVTAQQAAGYEVVCAEGPGLIVMASTPPTTFNCLELAGQAMVTRERDAAADVGQQCANPANIDAVRLVGPWAREAGIGCTVDQAAIIGKADDGNYIYEVGCADTDGYWLTKTATGWDVNPCWDVVLDDQKCRFSSAAESKAGWRAMAVSTEAAGCDVDQARRVGRDGQGLTVYELKCSSGEGYFVRVGSDWMAKRVATCAASANVAGGCRLTTGAPAAAAPATEE